MKYTFETSNRNNKYEITISVGDGLQASKALISFNSFETFLEENKSIRSALKTILDNTRFTVKERIAAEEDVEKFVGYLNGDLSAISPSGQGIIGDQHNLEMILEETPSKISDEEILDEK